MANPTRHHDSEQEKFVGFRIRSENFSHTTPTHNQACKVIADNIQVRALDLKQWVAAAPAFTTQNIRGRN